MKWYDRIIDTHAKGELVPKIACQASKNTNDVPNPNQWAENMDMMVHMEQVITYWSRSLKSAEQNYSVMEREALGVKEVLVHFQPFIEDEKNIMIMDHAVLQWARTYENANRLLAVWGAVFAAYPGLDIVHRVGIVHSNVDPLSRLPQIPPHQSPVEDKSPALPSPLLAQPIFA
jgi:RNase H-like domain found in reverse transcriptase